MSKLIRKSVLGIASVLALGIGGSAQGYAADAGNAVNAASMPAVTQISPSRRDEAFIRKDNIRWAQLELRYRGLYKGSLDGVLGPETMRALARFQTNNGLGRTALLDARTWETLTGNTAVGQGSGMPPNREPAGTTTNASSAGN